MGKSIPGTGRRPDMVRLGSALGVAREAGHVWPPELPRPEGRLLAGLALVSGWVGSAPAWSPRRWQLAPAAPSCFRASASFPCTDHRCVSEEAATDFSSNPWTPPPTAGPAPGPPQRLQVILCTAAQGTHGRGTGTAPPPQQTKPALRTWVQARP